MAVICAILLLPVVVAWVQDSPRLLGITIASALTCLVLVLGVIWLGRHDLVPAEPQTRFSWRVLVFFAALCVPWSAAVALTPQGTYFLFALIGLSQWLLPERTGSLLALAFTAFTVVAQILHHGASVGTVVGPLLIAVLTSAFMRVFRAMRAEALAKSALIDALERTQDELVDSQREQGRLAERARLARDLHDTTAQSLSSIVMRLNLASSALDEGAAPALVREQIDAAHDASRQALAEVRAVIFELASPQVEGRNLPRALERLAARSSLPHCRVGVECAPGIPPLDMRAATTLLRIAEASVSNAIAHAQASRVLLTLDLDGDVLELGVDDDGVGFDVDAVLGRARAARGFGVPFVVERARDLGGNAAIVSAPGEGTYVSVRVPLDTVARPEERIPA